MDLDFENIDESILEQITVLSKEETQQLESPESIENKVLIIAEKSIFNGLHIEIEEEEITLQLTSEQAFELAESEEPLKEALQYIKIPEMTLEELPLPEEYKALAEDSGINLDNIEIDTEQLKEEFIKSELPNNFNDDIIRLVAIGLVGKTYAEEKSPIQILKEFRNRNIMVYPNHFSYNLVQSLPEELFNEVTKELETKLKQENNERSDKKGNFQDHSESNSQNP